VVVSAAAVVLKPAQEANKELDKQRNILAAAGMLETRSVDEAVRSDRAALLDLRSGEFAEDVPAGYDQREAAKDAGAVHGSRR
jgi:Na+-transporting NADH:ubiquinone oxidoreductase subunit C